MEAFITYSAECEFPEHRQGDPEHMLADTFSRYLKMLKRSNVGAGSLCGNEAALHPELPRLVEMAREQNVLTVIETSGVVKPAAWSVLTDLQCDVSARIYHPSLYPSRYSHRRILDKFKALKKKSGSPAHITFCIDDPDRDHSFMSGVLEGLRPTVIGLELGPESDQKAARSLTRWFADSILDMLPSGVSVVFHCCMPCFFSNEVMGRMIKNNVVISKCFPRIGIRPDSRVYHCRGLLEHATAKIKDFSYMGEVDRYLKRQWGKLQFSPDVLCECADCKSLLTGACLGCCLADKREFVLKELENIEAHSAEGLSTKDLLKAGGLYAVVEDYRASENYYIAARRADPANGQTHLMLARIFRKNRKWNQAEDEYNKAARLLPENDAQIKAEMTEMIAEQPASEKTNDTENREERH